MKIKNIMLCLIVFLLLNSFMNFGTAYEGISEGDAFVWEIDYDEEKFYYKFVVETMAKDSATGNVSTYDVGLDLFYEQSGFELPYWYSKTFFGSLEHLYTIYPGETRTYGGVDCDCTVVGDKASYHGKFYVDNATGIMLEMTVLNNNKNQTYKLISWVDQDLKALYKKENNSASTSISISGFSLIPLGLCAIASLAFLYRKIKK